MVLLWSADTPGAWLSGTGPEADIVISSRVRLARNVVGFPFVNRMDAVLKHEFADFLMERIGPPVQAYGLRWIDLADLGPVDLNLLHERHLISREIVTGTGCRGILVDADESIAIMINEEDHLRIQYLESGLQLGRAWERMDRLDDAIGEAVTYAFDAELGYLTSCPTNVGTGLRVSVMVHLPGLSITNQVGKVFNAVAKMGLTVRGLFGEGTDGIGDFYQVSNQVSTGVSEAELIAKVGGIVPKVIAYERRARERLMAEKRTLVEDRIWRAFGILRYAHAVSSNEALTLLSLVRLGISLGIIDGLTIPSINSLFINSQPSHLQKRANREMEPSERDTVRAGYLRNALSN